MPDPFRHYEEAPLVDLPASPPAPRIAALDVLRGRTGASEAADGAQLLSQLLYYSAAISASKRVPSTGYRYALRVNPSSGNLHPTEFHFFTRGLKGWPEGLYHYRPSSHMAERRGTDAAAAAPVVFVLTSIVWREAWKYRARAYRYCLLDAGHAWECLNLAARAAGCQSFARGSFDDDELARQCRLSPDEWPLLILELRGDSIPLGEAAAGEAPWAPGEPNRLSSRVTAYPLIEGVHRATKVVAAARPEPAPGGRGGIKLPEPSSSERPFGETVRGRRTALDFIGGTRSMPLEQLAAMLEAAGRPFVADFAPGFLQLYIYAHRVDGLPPGVYRHWPESGELEQVKSGDQRVVAAALSLGQDLAGNACAAVSMIADLERAARVYGDRGYRYAHFQAGATGQRFYIAAEAFGMRATGIGAFFDDEVHRYLGIRPQQGQVVYHFAVGHAVADPRLEG